MPAPAASGATCPTRLSNNRFRSLWPAVQCHERPLPGKRPFFVCGDALWGGGRRSRFSFDSEIPTNPCPRKPGPPQPPIPRHHRMPARQALKKGEAPWRRRQRVQRSLGCFPPSATVRQDLSAPELRVLRIAPDWERGWLPRWWFTEQEEAAAGESAALRVGKMMRDASFRPGMTVTMRLATLAGQVFAKVGHGAPRSCDATSWRNHGKSGTQDGVKEKMAITPGVFDVICSIREHPDRTCSKSGRRLQAIRAGRAVFLP